jgi:hypothetical protein
MLSMMELAVLKLSRFFAIVCSLLGIILLVGVLSGLKVLFSGIVNRRAENREVFSFQFRLFRLSIYRALGEKRKEKLSVKNDALRS